MNDAEIMQQKVQEANTLLHLRNANIRKQRAYRMGQVARELKRFRVSPFYEDAGREAAWFAGYDGKPEPTLDEILGPVIGSGS